MTDRMNEHMFNPEMLTWARKRCGFSLQDMAERMRVDTDLVRGWESGEVSPTFRQARDFAEESHLAFGYLLRDEPPELKMPLTDFRSGRNSSRNLEEEVNLYDFVQAVIERKEWLEDSLEDMGACRTEGEIAGKFDRNTSFVDVAASLSDFLGLGVPDRKAGRGSPSQFWQELRSRVVDAGIWLMLASTVDSDSSRKISPNTGRGLALGGRYRPLIWVNAAQSDAGKVFTLAHELAHLWIGADGVSNRDEVADAECDVEQSCDDVAAEPLVPEGRLAAAWNHDLSPRENVDSLRLHFGCSRFVVARKGHRAGIVSRSEYDRLDKSMRSEMHERGAGGDSGRIRDESICDEVIARNGAFFTKTVLDEYENGAVLWTDVNMLLGVVFSQEVQEGLANRFLGMPAMYLIDANLFVHSHVETPTAVFASRGGGGSGTTGGSTRMAYWRFAARYRRTADGCVNGPTPCRRRGSFSMMPPGTSASMRDKVEAYASEKYLNDKGTRKFIAGADFRLTASAMEFECEAVEKVVTCSRSI